MVGCSFNKMRGMTLLGMLMVAMIGIFVAIIAINLVPPYIEHYQAQTVLESLAKEPSTLELNKGKVKDLFMRRIQVNNIKSITSDNLVVDKKGNKIMLKLNYETRVHVMGNIDAVLKFNDEVMVE